MCTHDRCVDDGSIIRVQLSNLFEDPRPNARLCPVIEAVVDALPGPESLRKVTPRHSGLEPEHDRVNEVPVAQDALRTGPLPWDERLDLRPLLVGQGVSSHRDLGSHRDRRSKPVS